MFGSSDAIKSIKVSYYGSLTIFLNSEAVVLLATNILVQIADYFF